MLAIMKSTEFLFISYFDKADIPSLYKREKSDLLILE